MTGAAAADDRRAAWRRVSLCRAWRMCSGLVVATTTWPNRARAQLSTYTVSAQNAKQAVSGHLEALWAERREILCSV